MAPITKKIRLPGIIEQMETVMPKNVGDKAGGARVIGETVRISFRMEKVLHTRLKLVAVRQGRSIINVLEGFVAEYTPLD